MHDSALIFSRFRLTTKIVLKYLLSPIGLLMPNRSDGLRVLFYHRVNDHDFSKLGMVSRELSVSSQAFENQLQYLTKQGYRTITLAEAERMLDGRERMDPKAVLITFDDGYQDNLTQAAPLLKKYGFSAVVFAVSEMVGRDNSAWPLSDPPGLGQLMNESELRRWCSAGNEIGSHTCSHPVLSGLRDAELAHELNASRQWLEKNFGLTSVALAYPGGNVDDRVAAATRQAGYSLAFTTRSGRNKVGTSSVLLRRTEVSASDTALIFRMKIAGLFDWLGFRETATYRAIFRWFALMIDRALASKRDATT